MIKKDIFPRLYANHWLTNENPSESSKNESKDSFLDVIDTIKSLPLPQLLSLLIETKAPFFFGIDESDLLNINQNQSSSSKNEKLDSSNQSFQLSNMSNSSPKKPQNLIFKSIYDNFMWNKFVKDLDANDSAGEKEKLKDGLLELFRWSIQPPHPIIFEKDASDYDSGTRIKRNIRVEIEFL